MKVLSGLSRAAAATVATAVACVVSPTGFLAPSLELSRLRPILGFGLRFQAVNASHLACDAVLIAGIGAIGGISVLGLWMLEALLIS